MKEILEVKNPKIGLALGSGSARGLAHIGVLKAFEEAGIPIDMVVGTSMGAIVGACFAKEGEIGVAEKIILNTEWKDIARMLDPNFKSLKEGFFHGRKIEQFLKSIIGDVDFKDLKIPFAVVSTDISNGRDVVIREGKVIEAVRASMSLPALFVPVIIEGKILVDGGLVNPVPTDVVKKMGADIVIGVNVVVNPRKRKMAVPEPKKSKGIATPNMFKILVQSIYIMEYEIAKEKTANADIVINPDIGDIESFEFNKARKAIAAGYRSAEEILPRLQGLIEKFKTRNL